MKLIAKNISKQFIRIRKDSNLLEVIKDFNLTLEGNKILMIMGDSGKGKTTLLNMLAGLLSPNEGEILLDDTNIYSLDDDDLSKLRFDNFGVIPQGQTLLKSLTVLDNVLLPLMLYNIKITDEVKDKALKLLDKMGILDLADIYPSELSGGELRRAAIARCLIHDPFFIFADEPTSDLDASNREIVMNIFKDMKDNGKCILMVTHDDAIKDYADEIINL